ncbi:MAG: response regulator [Moraxella sp.]|jgi:luxR family transcriptional regulator
MTIKVFIADDHDLVRTGIIRMLADMTDIEVVGEASCGESAILGVKQHNPNVVLLDVNMPNMDGIEATRRIKQSHDNIKVLALSSLSSSPYPVMLLKAGVDGYITKGTNIDEMVRAIRKIHAGGRYFSHEIAEHFAQNYLQDSDDPFATLSEREKQVLLMIVNCQNTQEIAEQLFVSPKTVNTYRYRIFEKLEKLGIDSDVKLTHLALRHGLIQSN